MAPKSSLSWWNTAVIAGSAALGLALPGAPTAAQAATETAHFRQDWCPAPADVAALSQSFKLTMSGCCIFKAERASGDAAALRPYASKLSEGPDLSRCTGENDELRAERARATTAERQEREREVAEELQALPAKATRMNAERLCYAIGEALQGGSIGEAPSAGQAVMPALRAELRRRGLSVLEASVAKRSLAVGLTECHMLAAWGYPDSVNRSTTAQGTTLQHVYGTGRYVYTLGGRITGIQH